MIKRITKFLLMYKQWPNFVRLFQRKEDKRLTGSPRVRLRSPIVTLSLFTCTNHKPLPVQGPSQLHLHKDLPISVHDPPQLCWQVCPNLCRQCALPLLHVHEPHHLCWQVAPQLLPWHVPFKLCRQVHHDFYLYIDLFQLCWQVAPQHLLVHSV